jgi:ABC-type uncharacterized transport system involved in gliding motility auxiliary subunit
MREPWVIYAQAQQLFDCRRARANATKIDSDVNTLVIVHPKGLSPATQCMPSISTRCGRAHPALFVDPVAEADTAGQGDPQNPMAAMTPTSPRTSARC